MSAFTRSTQLTCGNPETVINGKQSPCPKLAPKVCKGCFLIQVSSFEALQAGGICIAIVEIESSYSTAVRSAKQLIGAPTKLTVNPH